MWPLLVLTFIAVSVNAQIPFDSREMDFNDIAYQLPQIAPNFFANLSPATFQQAVNNLQANLTTLTDTQFFVNLVQLVAMRGRSRLPLSG